MKIVIDIDEEYYSILKNSKEYIDEVGRVLQDSVLYGIPLPKGHGRLIDADVLKEGFGDKDNLHQVLQRIIDEQMTILEAESEE